MTTRMRDVGRALVALAALASVTGSATAGAPRRQGALTFDDLPNGREGLACQIEVAQRLTASLKAHAIPAIAFVNEKGLYVPGEVDERIGLLRQWLDAGLDLGNHTFSHAGIDGVTLPQYQEEVVRGETVTRMLLREKGRPLRYFRHPQLRTGPTDEYRLGLTAFLKDRGYIVAPVTVDTQDYTFALVYADAKHRGDTALQERVVTAYRAYVVENLAFHEQLAVDVLGREVKHVLLLHFNHLNADLIEELIALHEERGYALVTLEAALQDPAYARPEPTTRKGWSWIQRWIMAEGSEPRPEPREPEWVGERLRALLARRQ